MNTAVVSRPTVRAFDMFCGAGGSSTGMAMACNDFNVPLQLSAVNHWNVAIATHERNHPNATHKCANVDEIRLDRLAPEGVDVLWASPSCTEHSYAKGGSSIDDQKRASAWAVPRAIEAWRPKVVIVENVRPFLNWGPVEPILDRKTKQQKVDKKGRLMYRPIKARRGETFRSWFSAIESLGYVGKWDLLNAADYGEAQTRIRLFVVFTAIGYRFNYPAPTHGKPETLEVTQGLRKPWEAARKIINFGLKSDSVFQRKDPLSPNTMKRIEAGIKRYCKGALGEAFLVVLRNHADAQSLDAPVPTIAAEGLHLALAEPEMRPFTLGQQSNSAPRDVDVPLSTISTHGYTRLFQPEAFVLGQHGGGVARSVDEPLSTISTDGYVRVFEPMIVEANHSGERLPKSVAAPLGAVTRRNGFGVAEPFIVPQANASPPKGVHEPLPSITATSRGVRLVQPYLVAHFGERPTQEPRTHSVDDPAPTVTSRGAGDLVELEAELAEAGVPRDRVVMIDGKPYVLDIKFRMLQPEELALAQGFPEDYEFTGTKEARTAQIGNAVPVKVAYHLMREALRAIHGALVQDEAAA